MALWYLQKVSGILEQYTNDWTLQRKWWIIQLITRGMGWEMWLRDVCCYKVLCWQFVVLTIGKWIFGSLDWWCVDWYLRLIWQKFERLLRNFWWLICLQSKKICNKFYWKKKANTTRKAKKVKHILLTLPD